MQYAWLVWPCQLEHGVAVIALLVNRVRYIPRTRLINYARVLTSPVKTFAKNRTAHAQTHCSEKVHSGNGPVSYSGGCDLMHDTNAMLNDTTITPFHWLRIAIHLLYLQHSCLRSHESVQYDQKFKGSIFLPPLCWVFKQDYLPTLGM